MRPFIGVVIAGALLLQPAQAQGWLEQGLEVLETLCRTGQSLGTDSTQMVCSSLETIRNTRAKLHGLSQDLNGLWQRATRQTIGAALDRVGAELGLNKVNGWVVGLDQAMGSSYSDLLAQVEGVSGEARDSALRRLFRPPSDPNSPAGLLERVSQINPNLAAKGVLGIEGQAKAAGDVALSSANTQQTQRTVEAATERLSGEQVRNLTTLTTPTRSGVADKTRDRGTNAVSTRAAIQALVEAQADLMLQQATSINQILAAQQDQLLTQALTVRQMGLLIEQYTADRQERLAAWKARVEGDLGAMYQKSQAQSENLKRLAVVMDNLGR